jgi:hypothetical protein
MCEVQQNLIVYGGLISNMDGSTSVTGELLRYDSSMLILYLLCYALFRIILP